MSLFKLRDFWNVQCGSEEDYDQNSLCIANIDNNPNGTDKIIAGSHHGILRIYSININTNNEGVLIGSQVSDLLLETDLKDPILQVSSGLFLSGSDKVYLAVLHSRKLKVFSVSSTAGITEHGSSYNILLIYEHILQRNAFNMVHGPFGQILERDFICVQSLDGNLTFYEQESFAFSRSLPNCLLPGPIAYLPHSDSFIVATSGWSLESYRYQILAISKETTENDKHLKGKKLLADWSVILNEPVLDIRIVAVEKSVNYIFVLGERNLCALKENGTIWFVKKFDFSPSCLNVYPNEANDSVMILVATHVFTLLIYSNDILRWAAQLPFTPVCVRRANLINEQGLLICLSSEGFLCCGYLGTNPSLKIVSISNSQKNITDYSEKELELQQLRKTINMLNLDDHGSVEPNLNKNYNQSNDLSINVYNIETLSNIVGNDMNKSSAIPLVQISLQLESTNNLTDLKLSIDLPKSLTAEPSVIAIPTLKNNIESPAFNIIIWKELVVLPPSTKINLVVTYTTDDGAPRVATKIIHLPLNIFAKLAISAKETNHTLCLDIINSQNANINLFELFSDLTEAKPNVDQTYNSQLGIEIYGNNNVITISTSTNSTKQKFRIQSNSFESLAFISNELIRRLMRNDVKFDISKFDKDFIPLNQLFTLIDKHLDARFRVKNLKESLSSNAIHFRSVQKRMLIKLKDRNPTLLNNLDLLIKTSYNRILNISDKLLQEYYELDKISCHLSIAVNLVCSLLLIATESKIELQKIINSIFVYHISSDEDEGWEERTELAIATVLNSQSKELFHSTKFTNNQFNIIENTDDLKKCMELLIKKLLKGDLLDERKVVAKKMEDIEEVQE